MIELVFVLAILGVIAWAVWSIPQIMAPFKIAILAILIIAAIVYFSSFVGHPIGHFKL